MSSTMAAASSSDIQNLEIQAVVFASMCALSGVYFTLFIATLVSTFRSNGRSYRNLRIVTIVLFMVISTHFISRSLDFNQARRIPQPVDELYQWITPLRIVESISTTTAGTISDGLLAHRFWVIFGRKRWALYVPVAAIGITALLGYAQSFANLAIYRHNGDFAYASLLGIDVLKISAAWGWSMFAINTTLTISILVKIIRVSQECKAISFVAGQLPYSVIVEAVIESALVTWIGVLFYEVASLAPQGHYTNNLNIGYVAICILPFFFGISQCLITARLSLLGQDKTETTNISDAVFAKSHVTSAVSRSPRGLAFGVNSETSSSETEPSDLEKGTFSIPDDETV